MQPIRRDLHFAIPKDRVCNWHPEGAHITQFFNTLSLFFPRGERFFIDSVRRYRDDIEDPELKAAVIGFIGQEAMHSREHREYNETLAEAGLPAHELDRITTRLLDWFRDNTPADMQLSATIALEHWTAMLADVLLNNPDVLEGAQEDFARMWRWHALEETEHKAVAYDVYDKFVGRGLKAYLMRTSGLVTSTLMFWGLVFWFHIRMINADPSAKKEGHLRGYGKILRFLFLRRPGVFLRCFKPWLDYFKPGFHPWQHDNRHFLAQIDELQAEAERAYSAAS